MNPGYHDNFRHDLYRFLPSKSTSCIELGCGVGVFGKQLKELLGTRVVGLELDPASAMQAESVLDGVVQGRLEDMADCLPWEDCDLVVCNDILEHVADPDSIIDLIVRRIQRPVHVLFSVPNVRYIEVIGELVLLGRWNYKDHGVLDRTHLRFFTRNSFKQLLTKHGGMVLKDGFTSSCKNIPFRVLDRLCFGALKEFRYMQYAGLARLMPKP